MSRGFSMRLALLGLLLSGCIGRESQQAYPLPMRGQHQYVVEGDPQRSSTILGTLSIVARESDAFGRDRGSFSPTSDPALLGACQRCGTDLDACARLPKTAEP